ncbi:MULTISPECIES: DnaD domain protein [unclassified Erysipelothrix]|uniref:DnaD domain protein n=1 Tax=unclassified Erysipelothrix TaxID=2624170 RepID=UPI001377AD0F|nr:MULTISPECIES: DnaD domain protein [unclassified Erysipelothrix]MBK2402311.1 DnaD domain protein [Erysipelothrix sp. strain 2 (EsS2-6-Brazil)]MBK2404448.1 DnaD domain protein [Erysipelothrix sp. strain 2 (EsS2-7-Brazil)]NBA01985.1 DnaD domain protein [Erysipelothrix rhusiopathiae]
MQEVVYKTNVDFKIAPDQMEALVLLYQPLFSYPALSLYLTLYEFGQYECEVPIQTLTHMLQLGISEINDYRKELERFALVRTFDTGVLTLVLVPPMNPHDFLQHPTFGRLYAIVRGSESFIEVCTRYRKDVCVEVDNEISASFDLTRLSSWDESLEESYTSKRTEGADLSRKHKFDVEGFFKSISNAMYPQAFRTDDVREKVGVFGSFYNLSYLDMKSVLMASTNFETGTFDSKRFQHLIEKNHGTQSVASVSDPYELDPISFLAYKQEDTYIIDADRKLLKSLEHNFGFDNKVINVLIEYILETNDKNLNRGFVEKVASSWKRRGVKTLEDALKEKETPSHTSNKRIAKPKVEVVSPTYSTDTTIDKDVDALKSRLKGMLSKGEI